MSNKDIKNRIIKLLKFLWDINFNIFPLPQIALNNRKNNDNDILIETGNYDYKTQKITLYINNRHIKDILRTLTHELIHHHQYLRDPKQFTLIKKSVSISDNVELNKIESEAYTLGNLYFRMFTESLKKNSK